MWVERRPIGLIPGVTNVVDAHPDGEEGVGAVPESRGDEILLEDVDLIDEALYTWLERCNERGIGGGASVSEVVGEEGPAGRLVGGYEGADPVGAARGRVAWEGWIAEGVGSGGEASAEYIAGLAVTIATAKGFS